MERSNIIALSNFLKEKNISDVYLDFAEDSSCDNRYALVVACHGADMPTCNRIARELAAFYGCPEESLPDTDNFVGGDFWSGEGNLRALGDEFIVLFGQFFDEQIPVGGIHELAAGASLQKANEPETPETPPCPPLRLHPTGLVGYNEVRHIIADDNWREVDAWARENDPTYKMARLDAEKNGLNETDTRKLTIYLLLDKVRAQRRRLDEILRIAAT